MCLDHTQELYELSYHLAASIHFDSMKFYQLTKEVFLHFPTFCKCGHNSLIRKIEKFEEIVMLSVSYLEIT